jgi:type IX secretion system PorP/SprF family membrane protein
MHFYKRRFLIILLSGATFFMQSEIQAQTEPMYSQYMFNMLNVNPAYAGSRGTTTASALFRKQWVDMPGAPQTTVISIDGSSREGRIGLGLQILDDKLGIERTTGLMGSYAFRIPVSEKGVLSLGLRAGLLNYRANFTEANTFVPNDPTFNQNVSGILPAAGAGVYYTTDRFYAGLSIPSLLETKLNARKQADVQSGNLKNLHFFYTMGMVMDLSDQVKLKPSMLVKKVNGAPVQFDLNANVWLMDKLAFGASYRTKDAVVGLVEWQINDQLRFGYSYDHTISNLKPFTQATHEMMLRFEIGSSRSSFVSPRYF